MIHQYNVRVIHDDETDTVKIGFAHELVSGKSDLRIKWRSV